MTTQLKFVRIVIPVAAIAAMALFVAAFAPSGEARSDRAGDHIENTDAAVAFRGDMRKLWEDHVTWTRQAVISLADGLPDREASVGRLLSNQDDIGDAVKPYYGDAAGEQLSVLLREHIVIAADLILAAKAGDTTAAADASARWDANANAIAAFLNAANPGQWPLEHMQQMMAEHLALTLQEAVARLGGNYAADVAAYDAIHVQILGMADMLSLGIINQFPARFR